MKERGRIRGPSSPHRGRPRRLAPGAWPPPLPFLGFDRLRRRRIGEIIRSCEARRGKTGAAIAAPRMIAFRGFDTDIDDEADGRPAPEADEARIIVLRVVGGPVRGARLAKRRACPRPAPSCRCFLRTRPRPPSSLVTRVAVRSGHHAVPPFARTRTRAIWRGVAVIVAPIAASASRAAGVAKWKPWRTRAPPRAPPARRCA